MKTSGIKQHKEIGMPEISVIVPIYNAEKSLRRCVDSILAQTVADFELILVDDGSTDESGKICDEYSAKDNRVRVFHKSNGGASCARNIGLDNARGKWVTFCDSDDYVFCNWLENYDIENAGDVQLIQQGAMTDKPEFVYQGSICGRCGFDYIGEPVSYLEQLFDSRTVGYLWIKAFRANIIKENRIKFAKGVKLREDEIFIFKYLAFVSTVKSVDRQGYFYFAPDWKNKYFLTLEDQVNFYNGLTDAFMTFWATHSCFPKKELYINSLIDMYMKMFAQTLKIEYYNRIRALIGIGYEECRLYEPLKWLIQNDRSCIISRPALLIHSVLRMLLKE